LPNIAESSNINKFQIGNKFASSSLELGSYAAKGDLPNSEAKTTGMV